MLISGITNNIFKIITKRQENKTYFRKHKVQLRISEEEILGSNLDKKN